ncbi:MAG: MerR family DNA-binding transcriptional regulator, partial [Microthrixaceae bacterium]|nr:MerR family DNA-binding transcriptional regulator [Microthrixaceae bacterium]
RVGELAEATGLTVRTLHHYESIGLLPAPARSEAGHRRYGPAEIDRLYRICLLRDLGLALPEVSRALDDPAWDLDRSLTAHLDELDRRLEATAALRRRVAALVRTAGDAARPTTTDLTTLLEEMTMLDTALERRISILVYADIAAAHAYLARVFGMVPGELTRDDDGTVVHGELEAGDGVIWLHRESPEHGLASPRTLGSASASVAIMVDDVDAHHQRTIERGGTVVYPPVDQPYGYREYGARDPEGGLWSFMRLLRKPDA